MPQDASIIKQQGILQRNDKLKKRWIIYYGKIFSEL